MDRLFLAVPLTDDARTRIEAALSGRGLPGRAVPPENWHLTLRFLGATPREASAALVRELQEAPLGKPFGIRFGRLGAFPRAQRARVVWLGVEAGADRLRVLAGEAEAAARRAGFAPEDKPFRAHLTLARIDPARSVSAMLTENERADAEMRVHEVVLYRSELGGGPPRYHPLNRFPLKENNT